MIDLLVIVMIMVSGFIVLCVGGIVQFLVMLVIGVFYQWNLNGVVMVGEMFELIIVFIVG